MNIDCVVKEKPKEDKNKQIIYFPFSLPDNTYVELIDGRKLSPVKTVRDS